MAIRTWLQRLILAGIYIVLVLAITTPMAGAGDDPLTQVASTPTVEAAVQTVTGAVTETTKTVTEAAAPVSDATSDAVAKVTEPVSAPAAKDAVGPVAVGGSASGSASAVAASGSASAVAAPGAADVAVPAAASRSTAGKGPGSNGDVGGSSGAKKRNASKPGKAGGSSQGAAQRPGSDDLDTLVGAGNGVMTVAVLGTWMAKDEVVVKPKKSGGAQLALTGGDILVATVIGLVLMVVGSLAHSAARPRRPVLI